MKRATVNRQSNHHTIRHLLSSGLLLLCSFVLLSQTVLAATAPLSNKELDSLKRDSVWYDDSAVACTSDPVDASGGGGSAVDAPADMIERAKNAFTYILQHATPKFTPVQTAGIVGNLMWESGVKPDIQEAGNGGAGYGIAQWSYGRRTQMFAWVKAQPAPNNDPTKLGGQLDFLLHELDTTEKAAADATRGETTINGATKTYMLKFERPALATANLPTRQKYAQQVYDAVKKDGGFDDTGTDTTVPIDSSDGGCVSADAASTGSVDCQTASGTARILCEAKKYNGIYYTFGAGHAGYANFTKACTPTILKTAASKSTTSDPGPCTTDCSSLVSFAVNDAFGTSYDWLVSEGADAQMTGAGSDKWVEVPIKKATAGDIVTRPGHVEIFDHIDANKIYTFGSHHTGTKTSATSAGLSYYTHAWHWTGEGSSTPA